MDLHDIATDAKADKAKIAVEARAVETTLKADEESFVSFVKAHKIAAIALAVVVLIVVGFIAWR